MLLGQPPSRIQTKNVVCHALPYPVLVDACQVVLTRVPIARGHEFASETEHYYNYYYTARGHTTTPKPTRRVKWFAQIPVNITCNGHFLPVNTQFSRVSKNTISNSEKTAKSNRATNKAQPSQVFFLCPEGLVACQEP